MSNLLVQTIKHTNNTTAQTIDTSGRTTVSIMNNDSTFRSDGGAVTQNLVQGLVKAWCKFQGDESSISNNDSFNVSGLTDNGTGDYTIAIDNDMANDDYSTTCCSSQQVHGIYNASNTLAGSVRIYILGTSESNVDGQEVSVQICGDLA
jgi:hypothetical protein